MIEGFTKSLGFLGIGAVNMNYSPSDKNMYKFEDENIDKYWRSFYAFYKKGVEFGFSDGFSKGRIDALNEVSIDCIKKLEAGK
jgi:hypothetical protein